MFTKIVSGFAVLIVAFFGTAVVSSADAKPFYKGKRIVFLGNYPAGGANSTAPANAIAVANCFP